MLKMKLVDTNYLNVKTLEFEVPQNLVLHEELLKFISDGKKTKENLPNAVGFYYIEKDEKWKKIE